MRQASITVSCNTSRMLTDGYSIHSMQYVEQLPAKPKPWLTKWQASALAANSFARSSFAAAFPLFGDQMYESESTNTYPLQLCTEV